MKYLAILISFISSLALCAQQASINTSEYKKWQVGVNISPDLNYRVLSSNNEVIASFIESMNKIETVKFGYSTGFNAVYNFKKFVGLELGIQYANMGFQSKKVDDLFVPNSYFRYQYNINYIHIPLKANFIIGNNKVRLFTSVGLITSFMVSNNRTIVVNYDGNITREKTNPEVEFNTVNVFPMISAGLDYKINESMNLRVEPTFRLGAISINNTSFKHYLFNAGLNISCYFGW